MSLWPVCLGITLGMILAAAAGYRLAHGTLIPLITDDDLTLCEYCDGSWFMPCECDGDCGRPRCLFSPAGIDRLITALLDDGDGREG